MKPLRLRLQDEITLKKSRLDIVEKDYALSYLLAGIAMHAPLAQSLVFKGGTALKKIFFGDYRFSVDLDFSTVNAPKNKALEDALQAVITVSSKLLSNHGPFDLQLKRYPERDLHPAGQEAFNVNVKFPWHRSALCTIKVEVTHDEPVMLSPEYKPIIHGYGEIFDDTVIATYHVEEIIAEKLRALLQTHEKLVTRGWCRPRARDYYDLWSVLRNYGSTVKNDRLIEVLVRKCQHRGVSYKTASDFFTPELVDEAKKHWSATMDGMVAGLPECDLVIEETKQLVKKTIF